MCLVPHHRLFSSGMQETCSTTSYCLNEKCPSRLLLLSTWWPASAIIARASLEAVESHWRWSIFSSHTASWEWVQSDQRPLAPANMSSPMYRLLSLCLWQHACQMQLTGGGLRLAHSLRLESTIWRKSQQKWHEVAGRFVSTVELVNGGCLGSAHFFLLLFNPGILPPTVRVAIPASTNLI